MSDYPSSSVEYIRGWSIDTSSNGHKERNRIEGDLAETMLDLGWNTAQQPSLKAWCALRSRSRAAGTSSILIVNMICLGHTMQDSTSMGTENTIHVTLDQVESLFEEKADVDRLWVLYEKQFSRDIAMQLGNKPVNNLIDVYHKDMFSAEKTQDLSESSIDLISRLFWRLFLKLHPDKSPQEGVVALQKLQAACRCTPSAYQ